jgi:hypothetical protein
MENTNFCVLYCLLLQQLLFAVKVSLVVRIPQPCLKDVFITVKYRVGVEVLNLSFVDCFLSCNVSPLLDAVLSNFDSLVGLESAHDMVVILKAVEDVTLHVELNLLETKVYSLVVNILKIEVLISHQEFLAEDLHRWHILWSEEGYETSEGHQPSALLPVHLPLHHLVPPHCKEGPLRLLHPVSSCQVLLLD